MLVVVWGGGVVDGAGSGNSDGAEMVLLVMIVLG